MATAFYSSFYFTKHLNFLSITAIFALQFFTSCNFTTQKDSIIANSNTTYTLIDLPKPLPITKSDADYLNKKCQRWYDSVLANKGFSGGMIVAKNGNIVFEKYAGTAHIPGNDAITANTPLQIASVSKTFTAMAVLKLWQDGKINIDDDVSKYFLQFNYPGVTIRSLLNHRSGLPNYVHFLELIGWDKNKIATNQDVLDELVLHKTDLAQYIAPPNAHFSYCNTNYALLALLIEKITGKSFPDFMRQIFFGPLQMKNSFIYTSKDSAKANPSYDWKGRQEAFTYLDAVYGDKNVFTTPQDLLIWDRVLRSNKIFTAQTLLQAYTPYSNEKPGIKNYGLGWRMNIYPDGKKMIFHNGWWHGSNACFIRLIKEDATIIVIGNKFTRSIYGAKVLCNLFDNYYTEDEQDETENAKSKDSMPIFINNAKPQKISKQNAKLLELLKDQNKVNPN